MEDELISKIERRLGGGITAEEDVVYLMVKIRKLLERKNLKAEYPVLLFYCDWSLHASMDRRGANEMLNAIDALVGSYLIRGDGTAVGELSDLLSLRVLREEICRLLEHCGVSDSTIRDEEAWAQFRDRFVANIADCPLVLKKAMRHVRSLSFAPPRFAPGDRDGLRVRIDVVDDGQLELMIQ